MNSEIELTSEELAIVLGSLGILQKISEAEGFSVYFSKESEEDDKPSEEDKKEMEPVIDFLNKTDSLLSEKPLLLTKLQDKITLHLHMSMNNFPPVT